MRNHEERRLEKRQLRKYFITVFQYLEGDYKKSIDRLLTRGCSDRTRENGFQLTD